ncbi:unnamed protein product [Trifolium pratense]|uniref:Uncharacterized protein n=1 Tax=Trifolium pratense TaxID=57577 RepID=A0ACB0I9A2_TRIPR|nr:unnamed protein product [Trifolium pratense]
MSIIHNLKPATLLSPSSSSRHTSSFPPLPPSSSSSFKPLISCSNSSFLSRRLFLPSVSGIWDALTGGGSNNNNNNTNDAILAIRRGMSLFRQGDVLGSVTEFDRAIELDPRQKAYLWQRGLSLYYLDRFEEGAEQFRIDVAQNPNDTEESIWCYLCEAQLYGVDEARKRYLEVGRDPRPVMRETYNMFKDGGDPEKLVAAFSNSRESDYFYASLYAGLYYESQKENDAAKVHIVAACKSSYGQRSDDYMASLSKVHCLCRNWNLS